MRTIILMIIATILTYCTVFSYALNAQTSKPLIVVIDPGHGGKDPGNLRSDKRFLQEKDLNLKIAKKLGTYMDSLLSGVKIIYTRTTDKYVSPQQRAEIANRNNADYFISVHCNHHETSDVHGTEIHIHNFKCKEAHKFAKKIDYEFRKRAARHSRGVKTYDDRRNMHILVVKDTDMPAVLVECGFMSNKKEEYYLNTDYGQSILASAIFRAFRSHSGVSRKKPPVATKNANKTVYRVQIMASPTPVPLDSREFKKLGMTVEEIVGGKGTPFRYKYFVGGYDKFKDANALKNKIRKKGFNDAFVVPPL